MPNKQARGNRAKGKLPLRYEEETFQRLTIWSIVQLCNQESYSSFTHCYNLTVGFYLNYQQH